MQNIKEALEAIKKRVDAQSAVSKPCYQKDLQTPIIINPNGSKLKRFIVMSDTHLFHSHIQLSSLLPEHSKPILLHCGDFSNSGTPDEVEQFVTYLRSIEDYFEAMVIICGNHETVFSRKTKEARKATFASLKNTFYLEDDALELDGIKLYGSPWVPNMSNQKGDGHMAMFDNLFFYANDAKLKSKFEQIPNDTHILLTHTPPRGILDKGLGCLMLKERIKELKQLQVHCFGHIHMKYGVEKMKFDSEQECTFINAALDEDEQPFYFDLQY